MPGIHSRDSLKEASKDVLRWFSEQTARTLMSIKQKKSKTPPSSVKFNRAPAWEFFMRLLFHTASELKLFGSLRFHQWLTRAELRPRVLDINRIFSRSSLMILGRVKAHNRWLLFTLYMTWRATWGIIAFNEIYFHILNPFLFTQAD